MIKNKSLSIAYFSVIILFGSLLTGCFSHKKVNRDFVYFQRGLDSMENIQSKENFIKVNDVLSIQITSKSTNQEQAQIFNLQGGNNGNAGYVVNSNGNIDLPIIGNVKASGLTKVQLQALLSEKLSPYVKDPLVLVHFLQFNINVLGEVKAPGTKSFQTDKVTIIDAINASGEMTDFGKKDNVMVIREESGKRKYYRIDMRSGALFQSPVYLLQPNDIVYVEPNEYKLSQVNTNPNRRENQRYYITFISVAASLIALLLNLRRL